MGSGGKLRESSTIKSTQSYVLGRLEKMHEFQTRIGFQEDVHRLQNHFFGVPKEVANAEYKTR